MNALLRAGGTIPVAQQADAMPLAPRAPTRWNHMFRLLRLLRLLRRHGCALVVLAAILAFGFAAADGYGLASDQRIQKQIGQLTVDFVLGENTRLLSENDFRYYGAAFEIGLLAFERALGLTDTRHVYLSRYLLSHAFFLAGAFACYLLACRLFKNRALAIFAMLLLVCHPRMYGHSFFNSKDVPFLSMFMIALLMAHEALRRSGRVGRCRIAWGDVGAFAGLGAWLGLAGTIRPMAFLLVALVALVRCADFLQADRPGRVRMLVCSGALALASGAAFFAGLPYLWGDPLMRFAEWLGLMSDHPNIELLMFLGESVISSDRRPLAYVPLWFVVTTPPFVTLLALFGGVALCARLAALPRQALADASVRFGVLLAACVLVTLTVVTFAVGNIYNGWRHLYFIYGPMCLGAAGGLAWFSRNAGRRLTALAGAVAAIGLACTVAWTVRLHPHEHVYFNFLVDRKTPERLRTQFRFDYWHVQFKEALEFLLDARQARQGTITVQSETLWPHVALLRPEQRRRFATGPFPEFVDMDYYYYFGENKESYVRPFHVRKALSNTLYALAQVEADLDGKNRYSADYREAKATPPTAVGPFNVHWNRHAITYLRENCEPEHVGARLERKFFLHIFGDNGDDGDNSAPEAVGRYRHNEDFPFYHRGVVLRSGGSGDSRICMARVDLRQCEVDAIHTGRLDARGNVAWFREVGRVDSALLRRALSRVRDTAPTAVGGFNVYLDDGALVYVKEECSAADRARPFFLRVVPFGLAAMPVPVARRGFAVDRGFSFATHGAVLDGVCVALARLPPFRARGYGTGQLGTGEGGRSWRVDIVPGEA